MKRSEIDRAINEAIKFFHSMHFPLPSFAYWTPEEWDKKGDECDPIRQTRIGWDVTDFGTGNFAKIGRTIFTLRNGKITAPLSLKTYAQKAMYLVEDQKSVIHMHKSKTEDIINQGGGNVRLKFWNSLPNGMLSTGPLTMQFDGQLRDIAAGDIIRLHPGESVCIQTGIYHQFWAESGCGPTLSIEVSSTCDDLTDNIWLDPKNKRFPTIEEDQPRQHYLCGEYPKAGLIHLANSDKANFESI